MNAVEFLKNKGCTQPFNYVVISKWMEEYAQLKIDALNPNLEHLNQSERLLYLLRQGDLNISDAVNQGINNPATMIGHLRKKGYKITPIEANTYRLINPEHEV